MISPGRCIERQGLMRFQFVQVHMGVPVRIVVYAPDEGNARRGCQAAFRRIAALEDIMSDYRPTSALMRLCARAGSPPMRVSKDLFFVLQRACSLSERSSGAFDVTVGPFVQLWRQARKNKALPSAEKLQQARDRVSWRKIRLDPKARTVELTVPGMRLDLGGIAKGYTCDCALKTLRRYGITRALIEAGGDIVVGDPPPGRKGWLVDIAATAPQVRSVLLSCKAISTSGDTEQYVEFEGRRYSHIVDPRTGLGLTSRIAATVIAPDGITSDSLATAACVLGEEKGRALVQSVPGTQIYIRQMPSDSLHQKRRPAKTSG